MKHLLMGLLSLALVSGCATSPKTPMTEKQKLAEQSTQDVVRDVCDGRCEISACYGSENHGLYCRVAYFMVLDEEKEAMSRLIENEVERRGHEVTVAGVDSAGSLWGLVFISFFLATLIG